MIEERKQLQKFATQYRLKIKLDDDQTHIILGKKGQIYEYGNGLLAVIADCPTKKSWTFMRQRWQKAGLVIRQNSDNEGTATFDPQNVEHSRLAISSAGIKFRRILSPAQRESLERARKCSPLMRQR